jgi:hypothetical protein
MLCVVELFTHLRLKQKHSRVKSFFSASVHWHTPPDQQSCDERLPSPHDTSHQPLPTLDSQTPHAHLYPQRNWTSVTLLPAKPRFPSALKQKNVQKLAQLLVRDTSPYRVQPQINGYLQKLDFSFQRSNVGVKAIAFHDTVSFDSPDFFSTLTECVPNAVGLGFRFWERILSVDILHIEKNTSQNRTSQLSFVTYLE